MHANVVRHVSTQPAWTACTLCTNASSLGMSVLPNQICSRPAHGNISERTGKPRPHTHYLPCAILSCQLGHGTLLDSSDNNLQLLCGSSGSGSRCFILMQESASYGQAGLQSTQAPVIVLLRRQQLPGQPKQCYQLPAVTMRAKLSQDVKSVELCIWHEQRGHEFAARIMCRGSV